MRLRRSPLIFWTASLAVALFTATTIAGLVGRAADRAADLGGLTEVTVMARSVPAGRVLDAADVVVRRLPAALLPASPPARSARGRVALVDLAEGEVVLASRLARDGVAGIAALLPDGMRAVAVPLDTARMELRSGYRVDVLATFDTAEPTAEPTVEVATAALVIDVDDDAVTLAVTPTEAPRVAFALARAIVTLALTPSHEPRREQGRFSGTSEASSRPRP
ncbi:MAG: SAF domain-containing protein [Acidimicrobiales bacterium]